jgi:hypothetical protein
MTIDLRDRLETSFGDGPAHRTIDERLDVGRRALRRRRLLATAAAGVAVAAVALAPLAASRQDHSAGINPVLGPGPHAAHRSVAAKPRSTTSIAPGHTYAENPIPREDSPVTFDGDHLVAKRGAVITARIANPPYSTSAVPDGCTARAVAVTDGATDLFVLGYTCPHGAWDLFTETAGSRADTLPAWLAAVKAAQDGGEGVR